MFAPIIPEPKFLARLKGAKLSDIQINNKMKSIMSQHVSNVFYLPNDISVPEGGVVVMDDIHSMPIKRHHDSTQKKKLFTLSQIGHYILAFKLSVHFCRLSENVDRKAQLGPIGNSD